MKNYVRLPIKNAYNVRELGGYSCMKGKVTNYHRFLRADDLYLLDKEDIDFLLEYGVGAVIDLRSALELEQNPNPFSKIAGVNYRNISLMVDDIANVTRVIENLTSTFLKEFYVKLLKDSTAAIKKTFEFIAEQDQDKCIIFHCAAGKDRTGIIAMLLLGLVEVEKSDIIANYEVTATYLRDNLAIQANSKQYPSALMESRREDIEPTINYIIDNHNTIENYLLDIGISETVLKKIKNKLS
jgi:Protein tyrosine/serine phosphatase